MPAISWTHALFEAIDDAVFVHDEQGNILEANPAACRRLGYSREELLQLNTRDIDAHECAEGFQHRLCAPLQQGPMRCEGIHRTKDGRRIVVDINTSAIHLDGAPAVLAVMRDITERKHTDLALHKQSQLLKSILDHMTDAIVVADAAGRILLFNPQAARVFGPGLEAGLFSLQLTDQTTVPHEFPIARCVRGESFEGLELLVRHEGSPRGRWISVAGRPLREKGGELKGGVLVCHDITRRRSDEKRFRAQYELARILAMDHPSAESGRAILQLVAQTLDCEVGILWGLGASGQALCSLQSWHTKPLDCADFLQHSQSCDLSGAADLIGAVWHEGEPQQERASASAWSGSPRWQAARSAGLRGVLAFPIHSSNKRVGVLELWSRRNEVTDQALYALLQAMTNQIGQFLDRQQVEKELRNSQALYESLVEGLPQNIFRKDRAGRFTFGNRRYCDSLHRPQADLLGKSDFDLFPLELAEKYVQDDQIILQTGQTIDTIEEHHLPDGSHLYVHVVKTPIRNAEHDIVGVQGIFWDVTQEVRANQAIADSEKRYRQLTEATLDGIVVINAQGNITLFNRAAERMFGHRSEDVIGLSADLLLPGEFDLLHEEGFSQYLSRRLQDLLGKPQEFRARRMDGNDFTVEIALSLLTDPAGETALDQPPVLILASIRDLTERNKLRAVLVQNEKLASIGLLSAGVAHEINNPLAFVANNLVVLERDSKGLLDLLEMYGRAHGPIAAADPELAGRIQTMIDDNDLPYVQENLGRMLNRTRDGIERVTRIVHSLKGMARTEAPRRQEVPLPEMIDSSLEILHGNYKRLGVVVEQSHDERPTIKCVPTQISQVVLNMLVNAYQAIEAARRPQGRIDVRTRRRGEEMLLEIEDNGTGIESQHLARLFDPFFTTKEVGVGTGLGLSISHHIITAHGGRIEVNSQPGEGTCFQIFLPLK